MIRVGVVGLGFMGKTHFNCYQTMKGVKVAAVCDVDVKKLRSKSVTGGNLAVTERPLDFRGVELYTEFNQLLESARLDAVSITVPTNLHARYTVKALEKGLHVLCEKPMALDLKGCRRMISAMDESGKILQIGHCIRFWPEYVAAKDIVASGKYGKVKAASFRRLSLSPVWTWDKWMLDGRRSGGAIMDLHVHDTDFVQFLFGMPSAVRTHGVRGPSGRLDHVTTNYLFDGKDMIVLAEGSCMMSPTFGFEMSFNIVLEHATLAYDYTRPVPFKICLAKGKPVVPKLDKRSRHMLELVHFVKKVKGEEVPEVLTPEDSLNSIRIVLAEEQSALKRKEIRIK
jgi:1,5-anhydro-D-fructose reductase (1,5-anhydro-D-mannitol-forming)